MSERAERDPDERGLSARHLILVFLAGVAVCGVFFSLGFLVGYNERSSRTTPVTEHVTTPAAIPPVVNAPLGTARAGGKGSATSTRAAADVPASSRSHPPAPEAVTPKTSAPAGPPPRLSASRSENQAPPAPAWPGMVAEGFTVQVVASRTKEDAEALVKILKARGYPVFLVTPEYAHAKDNLFRVQVGPFTTREQADRVRAKLAQEGFKPFVRH